MNDTVKTRYPVLKYLYRPHQVIELALSKDQKTKEDYHRVENTADGLALACELIHDGVTGLLKELHVYRGFILQERVNFSYSVPSWCPAHPSITTTESPFPIKIVCASRNIAVWYDSPVTDGPEHKKVYGNFQLNMQDQESTQKIVNALEQFQQRNPAANLKLSKQKSKTNAGPSVHGPEDSQSKRQDFTGSPAPDTQIVGSQEYQSQTNFARDAMNQSRYMHPSPSARLATSSPTQLSDSGFASDAFKVPTLPRVNALRGANISSPSSSPPLPATHMEKYRQQASSPSNHLLSTPIRTNSPVQAATFSPSRTDISSPFHTHPLNMQDSGIPSLSTYRPNIAYLESQANTFPSFQATQYEYNQPSFTMDKERDAFLFDTQSQSQTQSFAGQTQPQNNGMEEYTFPPRFTMATESSMQIDDEATEHTLPVPQKRAGEVYSSKQTSLDNQAPAQYNIITGPETQAQNVPPSILAMEAALNSKNRNIGSETNTQTQSRGGDAPLSTKPLRISNNPIADHAFTRNDQTAASSHLNGPVRQDDQMPTNLTTAASVEDNNGTAQDTHSRMEDTIREFASLSPQEARQVILAVLGDPNFASMVNMVYRMPEFRMAG